MEFHPIAAIFPLLHDDELDALAESIRKDGLQHPVRTFEGKILDGRNRFLACQRAGVPPIFKPWTGTALEAVAFVWRENRLRRQLDSQQIAACVVLRERIEDEYREAVEALRSEAKDRQRAGQVKGGKTAGRGRPKDDTPGAIADKSKLACTPKTSSTSEAHNDEPNRFPQLFAETYTPPNAPMEATEIQAREAGTNRTYLRKARKLDNDQLREVIDGKAALTKAHVANNSGENEWYTPEPILEAARAVLGAFDLDPASSELANKTVKAKRFFNAEQNGLEQEWTGRVWMNPPYAKDLIGRFADKLVASLDKIEAITLTNNSTDTQWFQAMASKSSAICLLSRRVKFISPIGTSSAPLQGQAVLYFGKQLSRFIAEFEHLGTCYVRTKT